MVAVAVVEDAPAIARMSAKDIRLALQTAIQVAM